MNINSFGTKLQQIIVMVLVLLLVTLIVFYGYLPDNYNYTVGSIAESDIYAPRTITDAYQTEYEALEAKNNVAAIFVRNDDVSDANVRAVETFFSCVTQTRNVMNNPEASAFVSEQTNLANVASTLKANLNLRFDENDLKVFLNMTRSAFGYMEDKAISMTDVMMLGNVDADSLDSTVDSQINAFKETNPSYSAYADSLANVLKIIIQPNSVFDADATEDAEDNAYRAAVNNPIMIERGAKIVGAGEAITDHTYRLLKDLDLINSSGFDFYMLGRVAAYIFIIFAACTFYLSLKENDFNIDLSIFYILIITFMIPISAAVYLSEISQLLVIELFFTAICAMYMGISAAIILSFSNFLMLWPIYGFNLETMFIQASAIIVCSCVAGRQNKAFNSASVIILPTAATVVASVAYSLFSNASRSDFINSATISALSAVASLVIAVGLMPIYELFSKRVTPVRLIELAQPGHPLLKRLFIEASGTYQHSMMVANLADSAAEAIGADAMLCKVASYYHDIGKLENPDYFTENQHDGINPHDHMAVMASVQMIIKHPEDGVKLARKYKLPEPIIKAIDEHHGTTYPGYFYNKACEEAKAAGLEMPDVNNFRYRGRIPSSRESAIIMLADTCEAAVRSSGKTDLDSCEALIRRLVKGKIEQDQLVDSGLSFDDIEKIIESFKKFYAGAFHERIKYPENVS
ncbi:MAG: HDIG domain-containing protein [Clostridiales bacterium]|nr:HDIG domain-containing protein [Clostridiales bacterium]